MKSTYILFPEANKIQVRQEEVLPPGPGEVLCQAQVSLISTGTETFCLQGVFDPGTNWAGWVKYPFRPGYSMSARVVGVGKEVTGLKEGDRVSIWRVHEQFFKVRPEQLLRIPDGLTDEEGTWNSLACTTQLAVRRAELQLGETVGVVGLGLLGQLIVQYLLVNGARRVIAIDPVQMRAEMARAHGATHVLSVEARSARAQVAEITGGRMLDAVWDVTGRPEVLTQCVQLLRRLGRVVLVGDTPVPLQQPVGPGVLSNSISILGVHGAVSAPSYSEWTPWPRNEIAQLFFDYLLQGRMKVKDLITHRWSPAEAPKVYEGLVRDRSGTMGNMFEWGRL